jgi:hypothetical protein
VASNQHGLRFVEIEVGCDLNGLIHIPWETNMDQVQLTSDVEGHSRIRHCRSVKSLVHTARLTGKTCVPSRREQEYR